MKSDTLRCLLDGGYVCEYAFPMEYAYLISNGQAKVVDEWLAAIDMRLARVGDEGAFFMSPRQMSASDTARIRDEFLRFRDVYGPCIRMLQIIRNSKDEFSPNPGEYIQHAELVQSINESTPIAEQLRGLIGIIRDTEARYTNAELVKRLLEHLRKDGYLVVVNEATEMYRTTGKLMQLTQVLRFLGENSEIASGLTGDLDAVEADDLFDQAAAND